MIPDSGDPAETLRPRLERLLAEAERPVEPPSGTAGGDGPADALTLRDLALAALLREAPAEAVEAAARGLEAPAGSRPEVRLALLRLLATAAVHAGDDDALQARLAERAALLRELGRPRQAALEAQLGAALLREPEDFEATVLAGVAEDERARTAADRGHADTALPDVLLALCAHRVRGGDLDSALELVLEAVAVLRAQRAAGVLHPSGTWPHAQLMLARVRLWRGEAAEAEAVATTVLSLPCSPPVRASALLVRALAAHEQGRHDAALAFALDGAERMARVGLRRGASSAAALVGRTAGADPDLQDEAVLAWRLAAVHAEKAEAPEASALSYWWAHQLVLTGRGEEAEPVLEALVRREAAAGNDVEQARALVDLGHALHEQDRPGSAVPAWTQAAELFERHGQWSDAASTLLAAGALMNRTLDRGARGGALDLFERAVTAARQVREEEPGVLASALHALGFLRCESGRADGLALIDEAIVLADAGGSAWQSADFRDTRARALWALERGEEAVAEALAAADRFTGAGDVDGAAQAELFAASVVAEDGRPEQAATLFRLISEDAASPLVRLGALTGLHQCLSASGDEVEAARVRRAAEEVRRALEEGGAAAD